MSDDHQISDRDQKIIDWLKSGESLQDVGDRLGLTRERVRQLFRRHDPDYELGNKERPKKVAKAIARKKAIKDAILRGAKSYREIAEIVGLAPSTVGLLVVELRENDEEVARMLEPESMIGQRFGEWEVLEDTHYYKRWDGTFATSLSDEGVSWAAINLKCRCSCVAEPFTYVSKRYLLGGQSKGCNHCMVQRSPNHPSHTTKRPVFGTKTGRKFSSCRVAADSIGISQWTFKDRMKRGAETDGEVWKYVDEMEAQSHDEAL